MSLNYKIIKEILNNSYNINVIKIEKLNRGSSNLFKVYTSDSIYILKEYLKISSTNKLLKEIDLVTFLNEKRFNVPKYIQTNTGEFYIDFQGKLIAVQTYIQGCTVDTLSVTNKVILDCSKILGKLVVELEKYPNTIEENIIIKQFSKQALELGITNMLLLKQQIKDDNKYKNQISKDLDTRVKFSNWLLNNFDFTIIDKLTMKLSHGDYSFEQLIFDDNKVTLLDFESATNLPIVWEVIKSYCYMDTSICNNNLNIEMLKKYFKEFMFYIDLNYYDLKYAPYIFLLELLRTTFPYNIYCNNYSNEKILNFAFLRMNICNYLYENADYLGNELLKLKFK